VRALWQRISAFHAAGGNMTPIASTGTPVEGYRIAACKASLSVKHFPRYCEMPKPSESTLFSLPASTMRSTLRRFITARLS